jgi:peptidyl-dipeptidase A
MRYFLAFILEFQFHRALSEAAGCMLPLHRCSIYESQAAGQKLKTMLDASAILDYFAPLSTWLDEQLKGQPVGW